MANKIKTTFNNLNDIFNNKATKPETTQHKIIIRGSTPEDVERKGLELQQKRELENKFNKTSERGFQRAMQYEAARLPAYIDYEGMEYYPLTAAALDLFMEESTTIGANGKMLNIHSNKDRIKLSLEDLFYNIINVNVNLPFWSRNMCKYGDNFVHILSEKGKGITHAMQMVNYEIERQDKIINGKPVVKFKQRITGTDFNTFEVAHFRLLTDDKFLPYGSSVLNKVRRTFRQLIMAEDAMLTYRLIRAGERRVFKIDVGNLDDDDVPDYVYKIATQFKRTPQVDANNGQIDYKFNVLNNDEDYFIPIRNGQNGTVIDTLPGADNLDKIQDIDYLKDNLFAGLGIPKPLLGFQGNVGGGKNMAQLDIRFAKKINRIQQALIQELNKLAIIHLYLLGFSNEDLSDFSISLTNPSVQESLLKNELLQMQLQNYSNATVGEGGIAPMSHTRAKREILNWSDKEIIDDLKAQYMERAISQNIQDAPLIIRNSGVFAEIDAKFGSIDVQPQLSGQTQNTNSDMLGMPGGGMLGGNMSGGGMSGGGMSGGAPSGEMSSSGEQMGAEPTNNSQTMMPLEEKKSFDAILEELMNIGKTPSYKDIESKSIIKENNDMMKKITENAEKINNALSEIENSLPKNDLSDDLMLDDYDLNDN